MSLLKTIDQNIYTELREDYVSHNSSSGVLGRIYTYCEAYKNRPDKGNTDSVSGDEMMHLIGQALMRKADINTPPFKYASALGSDFLLQAINYVSSANAEFLNAAWVQLYTDDRVWPHEELPIEIVDITINYVEYAMYEVYNKLQGVEVIAKTIYDTVLKHSSWEISVEESLQVAQNFKTVAAMVQNCIDNPQLVEDEWDELINDL